MYPGEAGFADELDLLFPQGKHHAGISRWDVKEHADAYGRGIYPQALKDVVEVAHEVPDSPFHKIAAHS